MTNKEAIKILSQIMDILLKSNSWLPSTKNPIKESFGMAIDALTAQEKAQEVSNDSPELDNNIGDLISRQAAIEALDKIFPADPMRNDYTQGITCGAALATEYIKQLPSAQPQRKRGKWIYGEDNLGTGRDGWFCSKCGHFEMWDYSADMKSAELNLPNFCPNCGARMESAE